MNVNRNALEVLNSLVAPPKRPLRSRNDSNWDRLSEAIQFPFPLEFLNYGRMYGTGEIKSGGFGLLVANPLDPTYPKWIKRKCDEMRNIGDPPGLRPTHYYPEDEGVIPFAENWSGELLFFTSNNDGVKVVTCPTGDPSELISYPHDFIEFLVELFSGKLQPEYFPNAEIRKNAPTFEKVAWIK